MYQKVHATLQPTVLQDPLLTENLLDRLVRVLHFKNLNVARFRRFGVISGDIDESRIEEMRYLVGIASVERDRKITIQQD